MVLYLVIMDVFLLGLWRVLLLRFWLVSQILAPPWPPSVIQVTAIAELLALIISFQFLKAASMKRINRIIISGIAILTVMLVLYLFAISQFVYEEPLSKLRFVKGFVCTPEAIQVFQGIALLTPMTNFVKRSGKPLGYGRYRL